MSGEPLTQKHSSQFLPAAPGIRQCATRRTLASCRPSQIPPDVVIKPQPADIVGIILPLMKRPNSLHLARRDRKSRGELLSTAEVQWSTTKSDGMCQRQPPRCRGQRPNAGRSHQRPRSRPRPPPPSTAPLCPLHQVALVQRSNERGEWRSHWLASEQRYCKGTAA